MFHLPPSSAYRYFRPAVSRIHSAVIVSKAAMSSSSANQLPKIKDVERLSPRVIRILGGNPGKFTLQGTNTYLIGTGPSRILIDTAQGYEAWGKSLAAVLQSENATVSTALLSHWHHDHVLGVPDLINLCPDVKIYKAKSEIPSMIEVSNNNSSSTNANADADADTNAGGASNSTDGIHEMTHGQTFSTQGAVLTALHCPGHTDDHIAFVLGDEQEADSSSSLAQRDPAADAGAIFSGDNVLGHGTSVFEDLALYLKSLASMRDAVGACNTLYPAHGEVISDARGKIDEYVRHRRERVEQVAGILSGSGNGNGNANGNGGAESGRTGNSAGNVAQSGWTSRELTRVIYKDVHEGLLDAAERGVVMILAKLEEDGRARREGDVWWPAGKAKF